MRFIFWRRSKRHKHEWEQISETVIPSFFERIGVGGLINASQWMYQRKRVVIWKCRACGKKKRIVTAE